jgi:serine O-acetyltransferase
LRNETLVKRQFISAVIPDWSREAIQNWWDPGRQLIHSIREYQKYDGKSLISKIKKKWIVIRHHFWSVVAAADIPLTCQIGGGLILTHPNGVVIHPNVKIGPNCLILQQVTIVADVEIQGRVDICPGAKIIKAVKVGEQSIIGANAVVTSDVPAGAIVVGVPAKVIGQVDLESPPPGALR